MFFMFAASFVLFIIGKSPK